MHLKVTESQLKNHTKPDSRDKGPAWAYVNYINYALLFESISPISCCNRPFLRTKSLKIKIILGDQFYSRTHSLQLSCPIEIENETYDFILPDELDNQN